MPNLNTLLMLVISDLNGRAGEASVRVTSSADGAWRVLHIVRGCLVASESSVVSERLGNMLASEGRLDPVLIEPVANEARRRGTLLGHQLIADALLTPTELASALERQARLRLQNAMATSGTVRIGALATIDPMVRVPLGPAAAMAFRTRITLDSIKGLISDRPKQPIALDVTTQVFSRLELGAAELKTCRGLAAGQSLAEAIAASPSPDHTVRLIGVLVAFGLWA